jgi:hypothetical protein
MPTELRNSDTAKELRAVTMLSNAIDEQPHVVSQQVVPVMEINPKMMRVINTVKSQTATNNASVAIFTTPTDKDFYLSALALSLTKDASATLTYASIEATVKGQSSPVRFLTLAVTTTTAVQGLNAQIALPHDLLLERGTNITCTADTAVGSFTTRSTMYGIEVQNTNG